MLALTDIVSNTMQNLKLIAPRGLGSLGIVKFIKEDVYSSANNYWDIMLTEDLHTYL